MPRTSVSASHFCVAQADTEAGVSVPVAMVERNALRCQERGENVFGRTSQERAVQPRNARNPC